MDDICEENICYKWNGTGDLINQAILLERNNNPGKKNKKGTL